MHRQKDRRPPHEQSGWETLGRIAWHSVEIALVLITHGGLKWLAKKADLEGELWVTPLVDGAAWLAVIWFLRNAVVELDEAGLIELNKSGTKQAPGRETPRPAHPPPSAGRPKSKRRKRRR